MNLPGMGPMAHDCGEGCAESRTHIVFFKACETHGPKELSDDRAKDGGWDFLTRLHAEGVEKEAMERALVELRTGATFEAMRVIDSLRDHVEEHLPV